MSYVLVLLTILLTVYGQVVIKWKVLQIGALPPIFSDKIVVLVKLLLNPWIISAFVAAFAASICWIGAMTKLELGRTYPFMALTFILVAIFANLLFGEPITWPKVTGLGLVMLGLIISNWS